MDIAGINRVWPEWEIDNKPLGKGSFGTVYKATRGDYGVECSAAIKVISIPQDEAEIDSLRSEGLSEENTKTYLQNVVNDFVSEIQLMVSFKGVQNIVSVEDYAVIEKSGEIGWDIFIRMELLNPLEHYLSDKRLSEKEVIKLGADICTALELCAKRRVIHRDIKPQNIFVNQFGDYKLGDFGIARKLENIFGAMSKKGTLNYMAPEVWKGFNYDSTADLYSLGLVIYKLMNSNRLPFLDTDRQLLNPNEKELALKRRLDGEMLPRPCEASPKFAEVILKACAPDPSMRYSSASEMKKALLSVIDDSYISENNDLEKTASVRHANTYQESEGTASIRKDQLGLGGVKRPVSTFGRKKVRRFPYKVVIAIIAAMILCGGVFAVNRLLVKDDKKQSIETETSTSAEKGDEQSDSDGENGVYSDYDEEKIASIISEAEALASNEDYEGAIKKIELALAVYPESHVLTEKKAEYTEKLNTKVKAKALKEAEELAQTGDYVSAISIINNAQEKIGDDSELASLAQSYEDTYVDGIISETNSYIATREFDSAEEILKSALVSVPNNSRLKEQKTILDSNKPQKMIDVCPPYETSGYKQENSFKMANETYSNGFMLNTGSRSYAVFNLGGKYESMEFDLGHVDETDMHNAEFEIYLDGEFVESIVVNSEELPQHHIINLNGAKQMKIMSVDEAFWYPDYGFANVMLMPYPSTLIEKQALSISSEDLLLIKKCPPYESKGYEEPSEITIANEKYRNGFTLNTGGENSYAIFNLDGKYKSLEFDLGHVDGTYMNNAIFEIYLDGEFAEKLTVDSEELPKHYAINLNGARQMKIISVEVAFWYPQYGFVNAVLSE